MSADKKLNEFENTLKNAIKLEVPSGLDEKVNRVFMAVPMEKRPLFRRRIPLWAAAALGVAAWMTGLLLNDIHVTSENNIPRQDPTTITAHSEPVSSESIEVSAAAARKFAKQFFLTPREELIQTYPEVEEI